MRGAANRAAAIAPRFTGFARRLGWHADRNLVTAMFEHIFVPTDFSADADAALSVAVGIAEKFGSRITLVHACEPPTYAYMGLMATTVDLVTPVHDAAREALAKALGDLRTRWASSDSLLLFGSVAVELSSAIEKQKPDLVVMGTHGRTGMSHLLLGSVAERLVRTAPAPVLTVSRRAASTPTRVQGHVEGRK